MDKSKLLDLLKEKRREIAQREGKELFKVFHNAVLEQTAEALPKDKKALANIKGWGKKKIESYGDEILAIINGNYPPIQEMPVASRAKILSVQELIGFINGQLAALGVLQVRGEITEVSRRNGYCFFTIKDSQSQDHSVGCFIGRMSLGLYDYLLEAGMEVVVSATPSLYKSGGFSLNVHKVEAFGEGALKKAFEALKAKLTAKGYFEQSRKRPIPEFVKKIGLVTSESGAAIIDFLKNLGQYGFEISLVDVRVEGDYSEQSIVSAIQWLNKTKPDLDVLVLMRGGGSLENFKAFNSEGVAEAIVTSRLPIITGIGHEKDESIADLSADLELSTPTAVAVYLRNQREQLIYDLEQKISKLTVAVENIIEDEKGRIREKGTDLSEAYESILRDQKYLFLRIAGQMQTGLQRIFEGFRTVEKNFINFFYGQQANVQDILHRVDRSAQACRSFLVEKFHTSERRLLTAEAALIQLNPEAILEKGYSIVYKSGGKVIKEAGNVHTGEHLKVKLYKGAITSLVEEVEN